MSRRTEFKRAKGRSGRDVSASRDSRASRVRAGAPARGARRGPSRGASAKIKTPRLSRATREEFEALIREGGAHDVAKWLGCSKRSVDRWLADGAAMGPATRKHVRLLAWLLGEGVDLVALAQRDPAALERLAGDAEAGEEPELPLPS